MGIRNDNCFLPSPYRLVIPPTPPPPLSPTPQTVSAPPLSVALIQEQSELCGDVDDHLLIIAFRPQDRLIQTITGKRKRD